MDHPPIVAEDTAFHSGRLLAHIDLIRRRADGDAAIATTCFQTAAAMPAPVIGALLTLSWRDLSSIRRDGSRRRREADALEQRLAEILLGLDGRMPTELDHAGQGSFATGFYRERALARAIATETAPHHHGGPRDLVIDRSVTVTHVQPDDL